MEQEEFAIDRVRRLAGMKSVQNADREYIGIRFSIDELMQLVTRLTGKRVLLVDEPDGTKPALEDAELILASSGQPTGEPYRLEVRKVSAEEPGLTNENNDPGSEYNATHFPKATGIVFMVGKERPSMSLTIEDFPVVGRDLRNAEDDILPRWEFITHAGRFAFSPSDGGGGTGSKTPPPGS
jgi:hypothetical protein